MLSIYPLNKSSHVKFSHPSAFFEVLQETIHQKVIPFSSARAALVYGLRALGLSRMDEILVPPFLSHCVLSALSKTTFPVMTPSHRTKAIMVYHQFGYPQQIKLLEEAAAKNEWKIVNNCVNAPFSSYENTKIIEWGDFAVVSFPKWYTCNLGGGLATANPQILQELDETYEKLCEAHINRSNWTFDTLLKTKENPSGIEERFDVDAVYGILPELVAFPSQSYGLLPDTTQKIEDDIDHRRRLFNLIQTRFPEKTPEIPECDVVPFAIPINGESKQLEHLALKVKKELNIEIPLLHFDFSRNMLSPDYRKALVIGCHQDWTEERITAICKIIENDG